MMAASISVAPVESFRLASSRLVMFVAPPPSVRRGLTLGAVVCRLRLLQAIGRVLHRLVLLLLVVLLLALGFGGLLRDFGFALRAFLVEFVLALFLFDAAASGGRGFFVGPLVGRDLLLGRLLVGGLLRFGRLPGFLALTLRIRLRLFGLHRSGRGLH